MKFCQQFIDEFCSKKDIEVQYRLCKDKCEWLCGEFVYFGFLEIWGMVIVWDSLEWEVSEKVDLNYFLLLGIYQGRILKGRYVFS